jgi:hypothetical protein
MRSTARRGQSRNDRTLSGEQRGSLLAIDRTVTAAGSASGAAAGGALTIRHRARLDAVSSFRPPPRRHVRARATPTARALARLTISAAARATSGVARRHCGGGWRRSRA